MIGTTKPGFRTIGQRNLVYNKEGIMGALVATDYKQPKQIVEKIFRKPKEIVVDDNIPPYVRKNFEREKYDIANSSKAIYQCRCESGWQDNKVGIKYTPTLRASNSNTFVYHNFRIRKLTPRECFRLMGMKDDDIDKIQAAGISNTQQYKMAGNSIVVDVLEAIFKNLFMEG